MTQLNSSSVKIFVNDIEVTRYAVSAGSIKDKLFGVEYPVWIHDEFVTYLVTPEPWICIPKILGDVKGVVSQEDRQLLKIAKIWNDEQVDKAIEQYIIEYKKYISKPKVYGKESWKTRGT